MNLSLYSSLIHPPPAPNVLHLILIHVLDRFEFRIHCQSFNYFVIYMVISWIKWQRIMHEYYLVHVDNSMNNCFPFVAGRRRRHFRYFSFTTSSHFPITFPYTILQCNFSQFPSFAVIITMCMNVHIMCIAHAMLPNKLENPVVKFYSHGKRTPTEYSHQ